MLVPSQAKRPRYMQTFLFKKQENSSFQTMAELAPRRFRIVQTHGVVLGDMQAEICLFQDQPTALCNGRERKGRRERKRRKRKERKGRLSGAQQNRARQEKCSSWNRQGVKYSPSQPKLKIFSSRALRSCSSERLSSAPRSQQSQRVTQPPSGPCGPQTFCFLQETSGEGKVQASWEES